MNGDGEITPEDARQILLKALGKSSDCADPSACVQCRLNQQRAKQALESLADNIFAYMGEYYLYPDSIEKLSCFFPHTALYDYALELGDGQDSFVLTARSKAPGIAGAGAGDDVWTRDQAHHFVHVKDACPECAPLENRCVLCRNKQSEARQDLETLAYVQEAYFAEYDTYADSFDALGFKVSRPDRNHYAYTLENLTPTAYTITISSKAPGIMGKGAGDEQWSMDQDRDIRHVKDACFDCPDFSRNDCADCQNKQAHAVFQLKALWEKMQDFKSQHGQYTDALSELQSPPASVLYEYSIETENTERFWLTARSKSPGITGGGQGDDDVWTLDERQRLTHSVHACPLCPQSKELIYTGYKCQSKQGEAKQTLGVISKYQEAYHLEYETYADSFEKLGLNPNSGDSRRYEYTLSQVQPDGFVATASSKAPGIGFGGQGDDVWTLNQDLDLTNPVNGCEWMGSGTR